MEPRAASQGRQVIGIVLGFVAVLVPATLAWQVPGATSLGVLLAAAMLGGAVAGRVLVPGGERIRAHLSAMACGALAGAGAFTVMRWWIDWRASVAVAEFQFTALIGALPGALLGTYLHGRLRRDAVPAATARERQSR